MKIKPLVFGVCAATLTCFGQAQTAQILYSTPANPARDNYTGGLGCQFRVGPSNVVVSHLGVFDVNDDGLNLAHNAGVFNSSGSIQLGGVVVPAGTGAYLTNGFRWVPLDPPLLLVSNTTYIIAGSVVTSDGDTWQDAFSPTWNSFFIGTNATTTRHAMYGPGGTTAWPPASFSQNGNNNTYGNVSLAYIEIDHARVGVQQTNIALSAGQTLSVPGFASGVTPINYQWFKAPNTPLADQTNATLTILNTSTNDSGIYFLTASNPLGGAQSANIAVSITSFPVGITQQPTNLTVFAGYPAAFSLSATGSPPVSYQWFRNGDPIAGATHTDYSLTAAGITNDGDVYFCVASNNTSGTAYTEASSNATLTVLPNLAPPQKFLHGARPNTATNNFGGLVGGTIAVGDTPTLVTHLGYFASQFTDAGKTNAMLTMDHHVGIFSANGSVLYGSVVVTGGTHEVINGYMWAPLDPPLVLSNNTTYLLVAETFAGADPWGDTYAVSDLNPSFATSCAATYWGAAWPNAGAAGFYSGQMYSAPNLAVLALSTPSAFVGPTTVTQYAGFNVTLTAAVAGQAPLTLQWFKDAGTVLTGQTNATLALNGASLEDSGDYYVIATNTVTGASAQSAASSVMIIPDVGPSLTQDIESVTAYEHQTVHFVAAADGTPTLGYQWTFNGAPIDGATNPVLSLTDVSMAHAGNYQLLVTNDFGSTNSAVAGLSVIVPTWGSYPSAVMGANLLLYYRFSDANSGFGIATNQGSLGIVDNGVYENCAGADGPSNMSNLEVGNLAVAPTWPFGDVQVPPLGVSVSSATIAAWVYKSTDQEPNSAIYYHRGDNVFGLIVNTNSVTGADALRYTWNGTYYNFDSGLILPTNQWALVALAVTPTNASLYLQDGSGLQSTNNPASHPAQTLSATSYVGWDTAGGDIGRRWNGMIDEFMIFDRALSSSEVNALYLGVPGSATLKLTPSGNGLVLTWPGGKLLEADNAMGPWTTNAAATSPYLVSPTGSRKFYRVQLQP